MNMKKILTILLAAFTVISLQAQQNTLDRRFREVREFKSAEKQTQTLTGRLKYKSPSYLSMEYDNGEYFLIDGKTMSILRDGKKQKFDIDKNLMMKNLSHALLYSFQGKNDALALEQNADIARSAAKDGKKLVVLTARRKQPQGCSRIDAEYDKDGNLLSIIIAEFNGNKTSYVWE